MLPHHYIEVKLTRFTKLLSDEIYKHLAFCYIKYYYQIDVYEVFYPRMSI